MKYTIEYFHARVKNDIENWPDGILADYARLAELLMEFGPDLRMPHSRAIGDGLFELRPRGREGIGRALYCYVAGHRVVILHAFEKHLGSGLFCCIYLSALLLELFATLWGH